MLRLQGVVTRTTAHLAGVRRGLLADMLLTLLIDYTQISPYCVVILCKRCVGRIKDARYFTGPQGDLSDTNNRDSGLAGKVAFSAYRGVVRGSKCILST
jgi:hypothetical protein